MKKLSLIGLALISSLVIPLEKASAHMVETDYLLSPDNGLAIDVNFSTGEPLADAPVKIYSPDNLEEPWMEGRTDENGEFSFKPDQERKGEWTVEIGEFSHADYLSVPVESDGIQIDNISQGLSQDLWASLPQSLTETSASASETTQPISNPFQVDGFLFLGLGLLGAGALVKTLKR